VPLNAIVSIQVRGVRPQGLLEIYTAGIKQNPPRSLAGLDSEEARKVRFKVDNYDSVDLILPGRVRRVCKLQ
jgi:hypothetical protein